MPHPVPADPWEPLPLHLRAAKAGPGNTLSRSALPTLGLAQNAAADRSLVHPSLPNTRRARPHRLPVAPAHLTPGDWAVRVDRAYIQGGLLGEGGVGNVIEGQQRALGRPVAIKSLRPDQRTDTNRRDLLREATATAAVASPHVVAVHDVAVDASGEPHVVMQKVEGGTWLDYLVEPERITAEFGARDRLDWHVHILDQVCRAVHHAHKQGVLHRDLKPDNVMIGPSGEVYVVDWGLAVRHGDHGPDALPHARDENRVVGTPRFMAPEMAAADGAQLSPRTDVYLLGGLLFAVLAGRGPHQGDDIASTLAAVPRFVPEFLPGTPERLADLVRSCMASDPTDRLDSAERLRRGLQAWREERAADESVALAERHLDALAVQVSRPHTDRFEVYRHFGAARFGFERALTAWPDHTTAHAGLRHARVLVAGFELDQGDVRAASLLVSELEAPPVGLVERLEVLSRTQNEEEQAALARARDADPDTRACLRILIFAGGMLLWTVLPISAWLSDVTLTHPALLGTHVASLIAVGAVMLLNRDGLASSTLNRGVALNLGVVHVALVLGDLGASSVGLTADQTFVVHQLVVAVLAASAVSWLGPGALVASAAYAAVFLISAMWPAQALLWMGLTNLALALAAGFVWRPERLVALVRDRTDWRSVWDQVRGVG